MNGLLRRGHITIQSGERYEGEYPKEPDPGYPAVPHQSVASTLAAKAWMDGWIHHDDDNNKSFVGKKGYRLLKETSVTPCTFITVKAPERMSSLGVLVFYTGLGFLVLEHPSYKTPFQVFTMMLDHPFCSAAK
ncbi:hypothetical protein BTVI_132079 [Pitangus sulphuratus]|nr:hypothetical protein BTVI_132079 [Pitangus sulphuratus]